MDQECVHQSSRANAGAWRQVIDARLAEIAAEFGKTSPGLGQAMADAVLAPGKRFRSILLLIAGEATGSVRPALIDVACAVELAHCASLVFDDLPCMDDARLRRGRPTTHVAFGQSRAILAGIALVTESLRLAGSARGASTGTRTRLTGILATALGPQGLCAGQDLDLHGEKTAADIEREQDLKTGALFAAGFEMLGLVQRLDEGETQALTGAGRLLGRVFQSYDDLLDVQAEAGRLGKDTGRDASAPGPCRGVLAVRSLPHAVALYDTLRTEFDAILARCAFETGPLADYVAHVLPVSATRAA